MADYLLYTDPAVPLKRLAEIATGNCQKVWWLMTFYKNIMQPTVKHSVYITTGNLYKAVGNCWWQFRKGSTAVSGQTFGSYNYW